LRTAIYILLLMFPLACSQDKASSFKVPPDYRSWKKPVDRVLDYTVPGHGSGFRIIYANSKAYQATVKKDAKGAERIEMPEGAIIIKEVYKRREDINKKDPELTIMEKSNSPGARNGWMYYVKPPGSQKVVQIRGIMCHGCHEAANEAHPYFDGNKKGMFRDYLFVPFGK